MQSRPRSSARSAVLEQRAHALRSAPTDSEARLWAALRGGRLGVAFRRQVVLGECIVDFLAPAQRLVVEVDGGYHDCRAKADARRDARLAALGYRVLRLDSGVVLRDLPSAIAQVRQALALW